MFPYLLIEFWKQNTTLSVADKNPSPSIMDMDQSFFHDKLEFVNLSILQYNAQVQELYQNVLNHAVCS